MTLKSMKDRIAEIEQELAILKATKAAMLKQLDEVSLEKLQHELIISRNSLRIVKRILHPTEG